MALNDFFLHDVRHYDSAFKGPVPISLCVLPGVFVGGAQVRVSSGGRSDACENV